MSRDQMARAFAQLLGLPTVYVEREAEIRWAIERFASNGDLADLIHIATSADADSFVTFDQRLVRQAGPLAPVKPVLASS